MQPIRIIEIPKMKAMYSGPLSSKEKFEQLLHGLAIITRPYPASCFPERLYVRPVTYSIYM